MIEVEHLVKRYGATTALNNISFKAKQGEIVGLLGANGAGKTSTMRILTGFMPPTSGNVRLNGLDITEDSFAIREQVGYMPERVPVYPDMTLQGFILFWARLRGVKHPKQATERVLAQFNLIDRRNQLVRSLSKGLRQRLGLAQALVHQPAIVILDEPTIGIDPRQVIEVRQAIRDLQSQHTVLFSSHILSEVEQVCDRVIILHQGRIVAEGTPAQLSKRLKPKRELFIVLQGADDATIRDALSKLPQVESVRAQDDGFIITTKNTDDARATLSAYLASTTWTLLEMRPVDVRLEDVYLTMTQ